MRAETKTFYIVKDGGTLAELYESSIHGAYENKLVAMERAQSLANRNNKKYTVIRKQISITFLPEICVGPEHA